MKHTTLLILSIAVVVALQTTHAQTFNVYIGAPGEQTSVHTGTSGFATETFNSPSWVTSGTQTGLVSSPGLTAFSGTYNFTGNTGNIAPADQYGGAGGTGQFVGMGNYWTGNDNFYSLALGSEASYFGFWWSAGDQNNFVEFYNDGVLLATFTSANVFTSLNGGAGTIRSVGGNIYNTSAYYGNPNPPTGRNTSEPYAYVSIYASGATVFDEIRFDNGTLSSTGFESDNHSLFNGPLTPAGTQVFVATIPEPGTTLLFGMSATWLLIMRRRSA